MLDVALNKSVCWKKSWKKELKNQKNKMNKILLYFLSYIIISLTKAITIEQTSNEILFKPMGQLIPELSWATVRIKLNVSDMFKETTHLCKASQIMNDEY